MIIIRVLFDINQSVFLLIGTLGGSKNCVKASDFVF